MSEWRTLTIDFPDHKYDKRWVKDLKYFLKEKKKESNSYFKSLWIKFSDKKKEVKII